MESYKNLMNYIYKSKTKVDFNKCQNFALLFQKFIPPEIIINTTGKKDLFDNIATSLRYKNDYFSYVCKRVQKEAETLSNNGYELIHFQFISASPLVVGLGSGHVLETSITLHHIFGLPYIPGTSFKGVCRMVAFWKLAEQKNILQDEKKIKELENIFYGNLKEDDEEILRYQLLFGAQDFRGLLFFLDSFPEIPVNSSVLHIDVMDVHYRSYYGDDTGRTPPGDWENPTPIFFLTVKKGLKFNFFILFDKFRFNNYIKQNFKVLIEFPEIYDEIKSIVRTALRGFGVGSKTRLGYGIFAKPPDKNQKK